MRKPELILNLIVVFGPLTIFVVLMAALAVAPIRIPILLVCFALCAAGLTLLMVAKASLFRQGVWVSFGPSQMSAANRRRYRVAYALLAFGAVLSAILLFSTLFRR